MDFGDLKALHADGHDETAWILFAQLCSDALYAEHRLPANVSHLVHYTTLASLRSMLGVVAAAEAKHRLATRSPNAAPEGHNDNVGHLRLYDTFSSNDPNEGAFFITSADETVSVFG